MTAPDPPAKPQKFGDIIAHLAPASILKAMAAGDVLQIVVFSVLVAWAVTAGDSFSSGPQRPPRNDDRLTAAMSTIAQVPR